MKKIGLLCLTLVLALGALGIGYAMWWDDVTISGTVTTDDVGAIWNVARNYDPCDPPTIDLDYYSPYFKDKNVGCTIVSGTGTDTLTITINNAYPCYYNDLECEIENTGSIPIILGAIDIVADNFTIASDYGENDGEIWIGWVNGEGTQLEPGEKSASSLHIHLEQCALQNAGRGGANDPAAYTFSLSLTVVQWNKYVPGP